MDAANESHARRRVSQLVHRRGCGSSRCAAPHARGMSGRTRRTRSGRAFFSEAAMLAESRRLEKAAETKRAANNVAMGSPTLSTPKC
jgi:hypothetical protein